jgi:hypothetical protein
MATMIWGMHNKADLGEAFFGALIVGAPVAVLIEVITNV